MSLFTGQPVTRYSALFEGQVTRYAKDAEGHEHGADGLFQGVVRYMRDEQGHEHGSDGKFVSKGGESKSSSDTSKEKSNKTVGEIRGMSAEELKKGIDDSDPWAFKPTSHTEDWGNLRGQGKRSGGMVLGGMRDSSLQGKKTYVNPFGGLPDHEQHKDELGSLTGKSQLDYMRARSYGLDHDSAMVYADSDGSAADVQSYLEREHDDGGSKPNDTAASRREDERAALDERLKQLKEKERTQKRATRMETPTKEDVEPFRKELRSLIPGVRVTQSPNKSKALQIYPATTAPFTVEESNKVRSVLRKFGFVDMIDGAYQEDADHAQSSFGNLVLDADRKKEAAG